MLVPVILNTMPTPGALLGTAGHRDLIANINSNLNTNAGFFHSEQDIFSKGRAMFNQYILEPIHQAVQIVKSKANKLLKQDIIMALTKPEDFEYVPPSMHLPILLYQPVRELFEEGRIHGFGLNPNNLPEEDVYGRLIKNGTVEDVMNKRDSNGMVTFRWKWKSDDPDLELDEIDDIATTRMYIDDMLANEPYDPTNYPAIRG